MKTIKLTKQFNEKHLEHKSYWGRAQSWQFSHATRYSSRIDWSNPDVHIDAGHVCKHWDNLPSVPYPVQYRLTNMDIERLHPVIRNYQSYINYCFAQNLPVALRADLFYFDIIHEVVSIIGDPDNKDTFRALYNGREDGKKRLINHRFKLCRGLHVDEFAEYCHNAIQKWVNFDASIFTRFTSDVASKAAFSTLSMYGGKQYFIYMATGCQGSQGPGAAPDDFRVKGFRSIHIMDDLSNYDLLVDSVTTLNDIFGSYDDLRYKMRYALEFVTKLRDAIKDTKSVHNKALLANLPLHYHYAVRSEMIVETWIGHENLFSKEPTKYYPHNLAAGLFTTEKVDGVKDLAIPTYGYALWPKYMDWIGDGVVTQDIPDIEDGHQESDDIKHLAIQ